MKTLFQFFQYLLYSLIYFIDFLFVYFVAAFSLPFLSVNTDFKEDVNGIQIFIKSNGVHTDIIMPAVTRNNNWFDFLPSKDFEKVSEDYKYISIGWGDKGFYLNTPEWKDLTFSTAFNAAFGLSETAMHVTYLYYMPIENQKCKSIFIHADKYQLLIEQIKKSFELKEKKTIAILHPGYSKQDCFYEANGTYHIFNTCNVWTGKMLKSAGIRTGVWTPFEKGVLKSIELQ